MAQCRPTAKIKEALRKPSNIKTQGDNTSDKASEESSDTNKTESPLNQRRRPITKVLNKSRLNSLVDQRPSSKPEQPKLPDVDSSEAPATTHSNMKTKQPKDDTDKSLEDDSVAEPKTRARKKASDTTDEDKTKSSQDEPKTSKEPKKTLTKPKGVVKKRPLGIRKTLRNKKVVITKDKIKAVIKQGAKRGRKPAIKVEPPTSDKETVPLIPAEEIKKEPGEDLTQTPNSRSSSPKTAGRRNRLSSDMIMMKSVLGDSPTSQVTRPYSMRSERSNSPSLAETKNLRSGKPRKVKNNLLNEVVMKEQKKRRRLMSDSKASDSPELDDDAKKLKRGRSCSRDGSEISKCSDITESDISLSETLSNDAESKELNKKLDKPKTDLDVDIENNLQTLTTAKVPFPNVDSKSENKTESESASNLNVKSKKKMSLKKRTSLDADNNNSSNRLMLETINNTLDIEDKANLLLRTDQESDALFDSRSSILTSMSKTFNSKEVSKNIRKARRGRKSAAAPRAPPKPATSTITNDTLDDKHETLETLSKEIDDLISNLDQTLDSENNMDADNPTPANTPTDPMTKPVSKFYGLSKPLCDNNSIISSPETPVKDKEAVVTAESTPSKTDDSENIRLHYEEDSVDKSVESNKVEVGYKCNTVASIDKLMDRLKEFEEFDKKRQRQESESKGTDSKQVMVTNDVVLIPKSGAEIKPLKDIQSVRSPEKPLEKENFLSCFENNSAISILKRDHARKSLDVDLPNSVTLIKRNSISRKESTGSNHSRESTDAISIFEKSLGKDVTLTEIRKSADKAPLNTQVDLHQFATLHPNNSSQNVAGHNLDSKQISITARVVEAKSGDVTKPPSSESNSRKSSESGVDAEVEKMATIEKIKSPVPSIKSPTILSAETIAVKSLTVLPPQPAAIKSPTILPPVPTAMKSPETQPMETEPLAPPLENVKAIPEDITMATKVPEVPIDKAATAPVEKVSAPLETVTPAEEKLAEIPEKKEVEEKLQVSPEKAKEITVPPEKTVIEAEVKADEPKEEVKEEAEKDSKISESAETAKPGKSPEKLGKVSRKSVENQPGPSNLLLETPESQKRKENVLRTLGLLTHKAAKEAKIEKSKERERLYGGLNKSRPPKSGDYTGTLKTVIKLNRTSGERERKKYRSSLKITFQKSKNRSGKPSLEQGQANDEDDAYYTIERREAAAISDGAHRKSYSNRLNSHDPEAIPEVTEPVKEPTLNLVIPEKASSFSIHPGRLCMDQCFYCGGKFGLFDTPCHIAQMKSAERQKKVLDNEEKLTIDSCLCDACYRHVDRRANCPSYRKRPPLKYHASSTLPAALPAQPQQQPDKPPSPLEEESEEETRAVGSAACHTAGCGAAAERAIRRKWLIKMRASVNKVLKLEGDYPGLHTIPLCAAHYRLLAPLLQCALCRRRLTKHHAVHTLHHGYLDLNPLLRSALIPVQFTERPVLCKQCRYYCLVLQQPSRTTRADARVYRRRLLQIHNVELPPESEHETEDPALPEDGSSALKKKKTKVKNKQRKSTSPDQPDGIKDRADRTSESSQESDKVKEENQDKTTQPLEEDIESLISSNKIMVPGAKNQEQHIAQSDGSEPDTQMDTDTPTIPLDKQTELQYLLQKQNNPAQFMKPGVNLTQKQRNILKVQAMTSGIQKPGQLHRVHEKNAKRIQKLGQIVTQNDKGEKDPADFEMADQSAQDTQLLKNLNEECTIESIPNKKPADITTLKNKWEMSGSSTQVKKNLSELSKKLTIEKMPSKKLSDLKYSNPVKRLETNPSISVRELFPGEEELPLQCNIEFNSVKGVTPEGWEKCNSTVQYDVETKRLWTELQRPYGNQSSFLRHLVLLEKYFRSGDLVLSQHASPHAANYSDSVQSRLRAYDNVVTDAPRRCEPSISLIEYRKQKPAVNGKSLLKTNQNSEQKKPFMPPPGSLPKTKSKEAKKTKQLPPELIAINTPNAQGRKAIQNVLHNIQQLVKGVSASDPTEVAAAPLLPAGVPTLPTLAVLPTAPKADAPAQPPAPPKEKRDPAKGDAPKKQKTTSKPWRPTLMPITDENLAKIAREPPQTAVDGRTLPSLVQVMSSGNRYHITLQDYNKMCIMRREKLQQIQDGEPKAKRPSTETTELITEIHPNVILGNGGTMTQSIVTKKVDKKERDEMNQMGNAATILKNVGLKNITIAPIPAKTATVTSQTLPAPMVSSPSLLVTSTPIKIPHLGSSVSITSETVLTPTQIMPIATTSMSMTPIMMPKIPRSLTVIPQSIIPNMPQGITTTVTSVMPSQAVIHPAVDGPRP